eukprot:1161829-Pelagomonas_calceolata.AAC.5
MAVALVGRLVVGCMGLYIGHRCIGWVCMGLPQCIHGSVAAAPLVCMEHVEREHSAACDRERVGLRGVGGNLLGGGSYTEAAFGC